MSKTLLEQFSKHDSVGFDKFANKFPLHTTGFVYLHVEVLVSF